MLIVCNTRHWMYDFQVGMRGPTSNTSSRWWNVTCDQSHWWFDNASESKFYSWPVYFSDNDLSMRRMGGFLVIFGFISAFIGVFAFAFDCNFPRPGNPATANGSQRPTKNKYQIVYSIFSKFWVYNPYNGGICNRLNWIIFKFAWFSFINNSLEWFLGIIFQMTFFV